MSEIYGNIVKCFAYLSLLIELSNGRKLTGYEIMVHVRNFGFKVSPGTVYHQISMLENAGIIEGREGENNQTLYEMTEKGVKVYEEFKELWRKPMEYAYQNLVAHII